MRYLGAALVVNGEPVVLFVKRLGSARPAVVANGLARLVARHQVDYIAVLGERRGPTADASLDAPAPVIRVELHTVTRFAGARASTAAATRRALCSSHRVLAAHARFSGAVRTERERYWEQAVLAVGAAMTMTAEFLA